MLSPYTTLFRSPVHARLPSTGSPHLSDAGTARRRRSDPAPRARRSEEHTSELQSPCKLVCRLLLEKTSVMAARRPLALCTVRSHPMGGAGPGVHASTYVSRVALAYSDSDWRCGVAFARALELVPAAPPRSYALSLHDALPISRSCSPPVDRLTSSVGCRHSTPSKI